MGLTWISWDAAVEASAVVGTAGVAVRSVNQRWIARVGAFARELAIVLVLYALWRVVATISLVHVDGAIDAGQRIADVEQFLHLPSEHGLQHLFLKSDTVVQACNVWYASLHIPGMI